MIAAILASSPKLPSRRGMKRGLIQSGTSTRYRGSSASTVSRMIRDTTPDSGGGSTTVPRASCPGQSNSSST